MQNNKLDGIINYKNDSNPDYVNSVFGFSTPNGEVVANFCLELKKGPVSFSLVTDEGGVGTQIFNEQNIIEKNVKSTLIMDIETAKKVAQWLLLLVDTHEKGR